MTNFTKKPDSKKPTISTKDTGLPAETAAPVNEPGAGGKATANRLTVLGDYQLVERLGAGGMGEVFKAVHLRMDRFVAVKVVKKEMLDSSQAMERFKREIKSAAKLSHPNIVLAYDAGEHEGKIPYLVMEFVEGVNLARLIQMWGSLPVANAINYTIQAARGLSCAHKAGIVHRDVKPANLVLTKDGVVKVFDLGIARLVGDSNPAGGVTQTGMAVGTPDFMSPEQIADASRVDCRTDIYSLGCTLFFMLTGKVLFENTSICEKLLAHREKACPSLAAACPDVPSAVNAIYQRMVAKEPESRFQSMEEVINALEPLLQSPLKPLELPISVPKPLASEDDTGSVLLEFKESLPLPRKSKASRWIATALVSLALVATGLTFFWMKNEHSDKDGDSAIPVAESGKDRFATNCHFIPELERFASERVQ